METSIMRQCLAARRSLPVALAAWYKADMSRARRKVARRIAIELNPQDFCDFMNLVGAAGETALDS